MGLLDSLFDPQLYGGAGGLLSRLSPMVGQIPQSQGFGQDQNQIAIGGYQMPRIGNPDQFQPEQVMTPPAAQPAQGQMPQQAPQMPSFGGDNIAAGFRALGNPGGAINKIADAVQGFTTGQTPAQRQQTQLFQAYVASGLTPQQAYVAVLNPQLAGSMVGGGQTDDIKEYQFAKKEDPSLTFDKFMARKKSVTGEYGLNYVYGTDTKTGKTVAFAPGKSGEPKQIQFPEGVEIARGIEKIDTGTEVVIRDKQTGAIIGTQKKDIVGKESAEERGKQQGQAQAKIPAALIDAEETTKKIDDLLKNEGLDSVVGSLDQYRPSWALGESGRKALSQLEQLQGGAFLQAFNTLKGGGAITEIEGQKAERAIARMQRYQSENDFKEALMDFRDAVKTGVRKLQAAAGGGAVPQAPAAPAPSGLPAGWSVKVN